MNGRVLVWPWHGRLSAGQIQLSGGTLRPHTMPASSVFELSGPGDTHLIERPDVPAITSGELARAPAGGEWWAGRALLSGTDLYGKRLNGWIYQAEDASNWYIKLQNVVVGASSTTGEFRSVRFGVVGGAPQTKLHGFTLPVGRASGADAARVFAPLRSSANGILRLHAVSRTGRHAVLALVTYQNAAGAIDRRPRAYRFYLASVTGVGEDLAVSLTLLYGIDEIAPAQVSTAPSGYVNLTFAEPLQEIDRTAVYQNGQLYAYDVRYSMDSPGELTPSAGQQGYTLPGVYEQSRKLMVQVMFNGENPEPVYIESNSVCTVATPTIERQTIEPRVRREYLAGGVDVLQNGTARIVGSGTVSTSTQFDCGSWGDAVEVLATSSIDTGDFNFEGGFPTSGVVSNTYNLTCGAGAISHTQSNFGMTGMLPVTQGVLAGSGDSSQPQCAVTLGKSGTVEGVRSYRTLFELLSNNLVAISSQLDPGSLTYQGAITPTGFMAMSGEAPPSLTNFGSYNPATGAAVIGATSQTNWI